MGLLVSPKLPDTLMFQSHPAEGFSAEGLEFAPFQTMSAWVVKYNGQLRVDQSESDKYELGKLVNVQLEALWTSTLGYFDFDTDMSPITVARSTSTQPWSREYFNLLKE